MDRTPARHAAVSDFATWRSLVHDTFFGAELDRPDDHAPAFSGRLRHKACGAVGLARIEASPHNFRRTAADVARHRADAYADAYDVVLVLDGSGTARQGDRGGALGRGHLVFSDTTRPYQIDFASSFQVAQLVLPRTFLGTEPDRMARVTGVPVDTDRGPAALLATLLTQATEDEDAADARERRAREADAHIGDAIASLCRALTAELLAHTDRLPGPRDPEHDGHGDATGPGEAGGLSHLSRAGGAVPPAGTPTTQSPAPGTETQRRDLRTRVLAWIEANLDDPTLGPAAIASAHFISTRYLHLLFEDQPVSVARHVRERRLDRIRHDLADPKLLGAPVSAVAARWGIGDAAQFSRLFRDRYGVSPSAYRTEAHRTWTYDRT